MTAGHRMGKYKKRASVSLKREPKYVRRKRGTFSRMTFTLPLAVAVALREQVLAKGGTLSETVEIALRKHLGMKPCHHA